MNVLHFFTNYFRIKKLHSSVVKKHPEMCSLIAIHTLTPLFLEGHIVAISMIILLCGLMHRLD
jgi:hypothetical protein